jgi:translation elongation factor EF-Ts
LKCATEDGNTKHTFIINLPTDVQQIDRENKVIVELTDSGKDFSIIEEIVNGSLNHLLQLQWSLIKADFGGHKFYTTKDHA